MKDNLDDLLVHVSQLDGGGEGDSSGFLQLEVEDPGSNGSRHFPILVPKK